MKICVNNGNNGGYFSGYLETLGFSHVVIDNFYYKELEIVITN